MADLTSDIRAELIATAHALADAAREATLLHFRKPGLLADSKETARFDPVTVADRLAEQRMRAILAQRRPDDAVLGEEYGAAAGTSGLTWVLDPIDGTRGYLSGTPTWGVLISVADASGPLYGLIDQPFIRERFEGGFGLARTVGPSGASALECRAARPLDQAIMLSTFPEVGTAAEHLAFRRVADRVRLVRYGMDCYGYALLAAGQVDLVIEAGLQAYDVQAPIAVIEAAGGVVTDWQGGACHDGGQVLAAANAAIHAEALALLNG
ncbi:MAG: inositol monophosphatase family protein [Pseudotabrizicola sp.]|uniref:inositol monophosphatase family protein n=1 Tax=Pseudotabrizicola sp. TaxID=2939647 RepID=UPI0027202A6A|nr:inositol monophosphatase family protein [Pseudotabrizicola sp.]MDO9640149.1 inositol monophosphatase family protein [Pseudotabrizicola sp.]